MVNVSYSCVVGTLKMIQSHGLIDSLASFGISQSDYDLLTGDIPWISSDRARVMRSLDSLIHGSVDLVGLPRFLVPAEYVAAVLATFVKPANCMLACAWREGSPTAEKLAASDAGLLGSEPVRSSRLFSIIVELFAMNGSDVTAAKAAFDKRVGLAVVAVTK